MKDNEHYWKMENKYASGDATPDNLGLRNVGISPEPTPNVDLDTPIPDEEIPDPMVGTEPLVDPAAGTGLPPEGGGL